MLSRKEKASRARIALQHGKQISNTLLNQTIAESWQRCYDHGLDPNEITSISRIDSDNLQTCFERSSHLMRFAKVEMQNLYRQIAGSNFMIALGDENGIVLDTLSDNEFNASNAGKMITPGSNWSELERGTNALGTCAITKSHTIVHGQEHYYLKHSNVSCIASPIFHSNGDLAGVLDASSTCGARQQHTMALISMAATNVENSLFLREQKDNLVIMFHSRDEMMNALSGALIAIDYNGYITAFNRRSYQLLYGLGLTKGIAFDKIFDSSIEQIIPTIEGSPHCYITDKLGSSYVARGVNFHRRVSPQRNLTPQPTHQHRAEPKNSTNYDFVAEDAVFVSQLEKARKGANLSVPMLVLGQTGTGKEIMARYIHSASKRKGNFIPVNCGAIPKDLIESELFGYESGSFTNAKKGGSTGLLVAADKGTLFLDEIGDLPMSTQVTLLRFLDSGEVRRVGADKTCQVDVQIVAATNVDLKQAIKDSLFRSDLFYRINVLEIKLPPIQQRTDFDSLVRYLINAIDAEITISHDAIEQLMSYSWPGNMRELKSTLTRIIISKHDKHIDGESVKQFFVEANIICQELNPSVLESTKASTIKAALADYDSNVSRAAKALGVSRTTIYKYIKGKTH
jgi:transcriptional regulator of acetoin/glycerol metabolism